MLLPPTPIILAMKNKLEFSALLAAAQPRFHWLKQWHSLRRPLHVRNELHIVAPAVTVWNWLVRAEQWWEWYDDAPAVTYVNQAQTDLQVGSVFTWRSVGATLTATVEECVVGQRLAWLVKGPGIRAYHSWRLRETLTGCHVITEQTQAGWRSTLRELFYPQHLLQHHQAWLTQLSGQALQARPPYCITMAAPHAF